MSKPTSGIPSPRYGNLGLWIFSLGPGHPDAPGERLQMAILGQDGQVVRRFEQVRGKCLDPGYTDYWGSARCRPARYLYPLVDIDPSGRETTIVPDFSQAEGKERFFQLVGAWVAEHGSPDFDLKLAA